ncbi:hypothetical protein C8J57DRAFT_1302878, partial [Mycena rebaudengoi]
MRAQRGTPLHRTVPIPAILPAPRAAAFNAPPPFTFILFSAVRQPASQRRDLPAALRAAQSPPLTAPPCYFLFDFPPPHYRLLCVSMPRRRAAPLLRNVLKAPAAPSTFFIGFFASPRPASQCLDVSAARTALQSRPILRALAWCPHRAALAFL